MHSWQLLGVSVIDRDVIISHVSVFRFAAGHSGPADSTFLAQGSLYGELNLVPDKTIQSVKFIHRPERTTYHRHRQVVSLSFSYLSTPR